MTISIGSAVGECKIVALWCPTIGSYYHIDKNGKIVKAEETSMIEHIKQTVTQEIWNETLLDVIEGVQFVETNSNEHVAGFDKYVIVIDDEASGELLNAVNASKIPYRISEDMPPNRILFVRLAEHESLMVDDDYKMFGIDIINENLMSENVNA